MASTGITSAGTHAPALAAADDRFQDALLGELTRLTGVRMPGQSVG